MSECCRRCGSIDLTTTIMDHGPHYARIDCKDCGKFVKWGKKPVDSKPVESKPVEVKPESNDKINETIKNTGGQSGMNNICLIGRLTKDPEVKYTSTSNTAVAGFTLAVNRRFKQEGQPEADFPNIVVWDKAAEFVGKYFKKGLQVYIRGRLQTRSWDDNDGKKHYVTEVVAEEVGFADSKKDDSGSGNPQTQQPAQQTPQQNNPPYQQPGGPFNSTNWQQPQGNPPQQGQTTRMPWDIPAGGTTNAT